MASEGTRPAPQPETDLPPEVLNPRPDDPRRCFICLTDEDPSDEPSSWVNPCPCTLEAHQDCMLSWVTNCERSNKPLLCPVCKSKIELEGPWDPLVALTDSVARRFTRASPILLAGSVSLGVQFSLQMYGALALWTFAGREALISYVMGPGASVNSAGLLPARDRLGNALVLTNVAPALLIGKLSPWLGNKVFLPTACFYGVYHVMHDDNFLSWPPSPQLAMAIFPYVRSMYYNLWREFVFPYEVNLNRKLIGLPELQPRQENQRNEQANANNNDEGGGGVIGFLQSILDALDPDDEHDHDVHNGGEVRIVGGAEGEEGGLMLELVIEEVADGEDDFMEMEIIHDSDVEIIHDGHVEVVREGDEGSDTNEEMPPLLDLPPRGAPATNRLANQPENPGGEAREPPPVVEPAAPVDAPAEPEVQIPIVDEQPEGQNHEVPQAPPAQRGIGSILSTVSNSIVSALILPGVSFAMGELLRLALPKSWTTSRGAFFWNNTGRPGMLQQQWGRSLIGGCLYVVLKDVVRVYTKHRKVAAMDKRRVKNVGRRRGGSR